MKNRLIPGQLVYWQNAPAIILELKGLEEVIVRIIEDKRTEIVRAHDLNFSKQNETIENSQFLLSKDKEWDKAMERYRIILPLLEKVKRTQSDYSRISKENGVSVPTLYRWIKRFEGSGLVSSLLRPPRKDIGSSRLNEETEAIISDLIKSYYLKKERPTVRQLHRRIEQSCREVDLVPPTINTIHARVKDVNEVESMRARFSPKKAKQKYSPITGTFPGADYPNAVVQIDHTKVDIILVDEIHRHPIGRPYLTIAIDVTTKMISGFRLTLDPPSALSAGLCIAHAVMSKEYWLAKRNIHADWPIYGKMQKIHLDNAKEFRGNMLKRACEQHGIIHELRPKGQPNYGPHVERAFRTFMDEVHTIPGTTFSNIREKSDYDSESNACMTLAELEIWFTTFLVYCYHHQPHKGINDVAPIKLYNDYVFGFDDRPGVGLPLPIQDEETFRLDFTPYYERTIQRTGVVLDNIQYFAPCLRNWVNKTDRDDPKKARKYVFARDPRDISKIYFLDPLTHRYTAIPYLDNRLPAISLWELRAVTAKLREENKSSINESMIFRGIKKMRALEEEAIEKTRLARQGRASEKRKRRALARRKEHESCYQQSSVKVKPLVDLMDDDDDIQPFGEIISGN